jgi:hypothetical protein
MFVLSARQQTPFIASQSKLTHFIGSKQSCLTTEPMVEKE